MSLATGGYNLSLRSLASRADSDYLSLPCFKDDLRLVDNGGVFASGNFFEVFLDRLAPPGVEACPSFHHGVLEFPRFRAELCPSLKSSNEPGRFGDPWLESDESSETSSSESEESCTMADALRNRSEDFLDLLLSFLTGVLGRLGEESRIGTSTEEEELS